MKGMPVIKSKLTMPQLPPTVVLLERLQSLCKEMYGRKAVSITAPAGYGKTTLMVTALNDYKFKGCRICWYRLDEEDRDLAVFYTHLVETLFPEEEGIWEVPRSHLADCGDIFAQHQYLNALLCQELWAFHNLRSDLKTFIVFDDFQQIMDTPDITGAIQFFLDNLPDNCRVIVSSRCETGLLTGKRRLEKDILEITLSELCFSEDELTGLVKVRSGIIPEQSLLQKIMLHTEGWAAGIILVCQMLSRSGADEASNILDSSGQKEVFFKYIVTEILKAVDAHLLRFLAKAAILRDFTADEAITVFGEDNAPQLLEECEQKGLFIQKISGAATTYRFHSLFREALQQLQSQYLSPEEVKNYHLKAAAYYIEHQIFERAIEHFILCDSVEQAVALITRESARLIAFEAADQFRLWIRLLPEEVVSSSGHLLFIKSFIHYQMDIDYTMHLLERALTIFQQADDIAMQFHTLTQITSLYTLRNDVRGIRKFHALAMELSERLQGLPLADMLFVFDLSVVSFWEEKLTRVATLTRRIGTLSLNVEWQYVAYFYSAFTYWGLGALSLAESHVQEALKLEFVKRTALFNGYCQLLYSSLLQLKDEPDAFSLQLNELLEISEKHNYKYILGFGKRLAAIDSYRRHDLDGALEQIDASTRFFEELGNQAMANSNRLYQCLWLCGREDPSGLPAGAGNRRDDSQKLLAEARKVLKDLTAAPTGMCLQEIGLSVLGAIAREAGNYKLAEKSLAAAVKRSKAKGAKQVLAGACLHFAKLCYDTGDSVRGEDYLKRAFDLAVENKYVMFWDMHFPTLVEMAARCVKSSIHADYAQALIARYYGNDAAEYLGRAALLTSDEQLKDIAGAFLSQYDPQDEANAPRISINLFGRFSLTVNDITIPGNEWKTKKITGILQYLLINRGRSVSRNQLIDIFWPEADRKLALNSLRAALFELRKVLRKYNVPLEGKEALLIESRDSLVVHAGNPLTVDVDLFRTQFEELRKLNPGSDGWARKKTILEKMTTLYQGNFLEEVEYVWVIAEREELRSVYFAAIMELANIYITEGDNMKAEKLLLKILRMDLYNEVACLSLIKLYIATNQRGRAVKLYSNFAKNFEKELRIKPDKKLALVFSEPE